MLRGIRCSTCLRFGGRAEVLSGAESGLYAAICSSYAEGSRWWWSMGKSAKRCARRQVMGNQHCSDAPHRAPIKTVGIA